MKRRLAALGALLGLAAALIVADRCAPPDLSRLAEASSVVADRSGEPLRVFTTATGLWRLPAGPEQVSPGYLRLLLDVEDKRFWAHPGVDPLALARATLQLATRGHVVSGGSTLTMQVVRRLEPRPRTLRSKLIEIARALQLEAHLSKPEILRAYLTLAPMGRNLEGLRAGSLAWFGKEPTQLSDAEAALLVALPQNPTGFRPDTRPEAARLARAKVLRRGARDGILAEDILPSALATPISSARHAMPILAPHLAERLVREAGPGRPVATTLDRELQAGTERLLAQALDTLPRPVNLAAIVADWRSGEVLARAGSAGYLDARRSGAIDMTRALRSPGSTLKPFVYGMAFENLLAHPGSLVRDAATRFDDYAPHNFDGGFNGDVTVRQALQWSLNLPAVVVLQRIGPVAFTERFKASGLPLVFNDADATPGLPVALGGVGTTLETLVTAYAALADGGTLKPLREQPGGNDPVPDGPPGGALLARASADAVVDILSDMPPPRGLGSRAGRIAYKTGTSYRFRDGWAVGFNDDRVIGVWMGRADGASCPSCLGANAAGLLFRLFDLLPPAPLRGRVLDPIFASPPPPALARLDSADAPGTPDQPHITFPIAQSHLLVDAGPDDLRGPIELEASGGRRPYRWLVDGRPVDSPAFARAALWHPQGLGFATVEVVDATGRSDEATIRIVDRHSP